MRKELIQYRLQKARETLEDAELLISNNRLTSAINRLYYSLFYAVLALLQTKDLASSKHSGVHSLFNQHFVKIGVVSKETGLFMENCLRIEEKVIILITRNLVLMKSRRS